MTSSTDSTAVSGQIEVKSPNKEVKIIKGSSDEFALGQVDKIYFESEKTYR